MDWNEQKYHDYVINLYGPNRKNKGRGEREQANVYREISNS